MSFFDFVKPIRKQYDGQILERAELIAKIFADGDNFSNKELGRDFVDVTMKLYFPNYMTRQDEKKWAFITGIGYGILYLISIIFIPNPTPSQHQGFRLFSALAAAGFVTFLPGFLNVNFSPTTKVVIKAGGAIAAFVLVYFFLAA